MEPRSSRQKRRIRKQRKRLFRAFTSSVAISSLLLGTARLTGPTYGAFTSIQDQDISVQACFIFPKEIEKRRDLTYEWKEEAITLMQEILAKASEINVAEMTEKIDGMITPEEGSTEAPPAVSFDTTTIEGLQAQQESIRAEMAAIQETITANEQKVANLEALIVEIQEMQTKLQDILSNEFPKGEEKAQENLKKIEDTLEFIKGIVKLAIEECNYDPEFFELILMQIEGYKEELTLFIEEFAKAKTLTEEQIEQLTAKIEEVNKTMEDLRKQNEDLLTKIADLEGMLAAIDEQIKAFEEIQKKKNALKEGAAQLIQKLIDSKNLTADQIQYLIDKLAEINAALENKDLTADISGLDQAIADIEKEMTELEKIQVQKSGLKEGTSLLIQRINESTTLSDEEKQALIEKLTGLNSAIDSGNLSAGTDEFEKALAEIEKEMKQKEEEARLEQEKIEKEKLEQEQQEQEQQEGEDDETQPQQPNPKEGIDALIKQITESTTLTDEQKQELLDKLAELEHSNGGNPSENTNDLDKALSEIEKEMKQKEEEAKAEQEEKEKTEEEKTEEGKNPEEGIEDPSKEESPKDPGKPDQDHPAKEDEKKPEEEQPVKENDKEEAPSPQPVTENSSENNLINNLLNSGAVQPRINNREAPNKNLSIENARLDMRTEESTVEPEREN